MKIRDLKQEIADALIQRYGIVIADVLLKDVPQGQREHAFDALGSVYATLDGEMPVLGFAGAPLTLAVFMIEGKSFGILIAAG